MQKFLLIEGSSCVQQPCYENLRRNAAGNAAMRIALDAMGGDYAPKNTIEGAVLALKEYPYIEKLFLVGDALATGSELKRLDFKDARIEILHASEVVSMKEYAAKAVRHKKDASICRAVDLVKNGSAQAVVSAGHTGAAVVACVLKLRTLKGIDRPAIACLLPTQNNVFVLIDGGANSDSNPENLVQFAIMGSVFSAHVLGYNNPSVALMSIDEEDMRGNEVTKKAFKLLKASGLNFRGNIEGRDLFEKPAEVVVCDGFTGNVVLKTTEAVAHAIFSWFKLELFRSPFRKLGAKLAEGAFKSIRKKINYEEYGGMPLLGVNGVCIIAHGASSPVAVKNAIRAATGSIKQEINPKILRAVQSYKEKFPAAPTPVQSTETNGFDHRHRQLRSRTRRDEQGTREDV